MRKTKKAIASLAIAGMVLSMAPLSVFGATTTNRLGGAGRVETAIQIAAQGWTASDSVIVVPADDANVVDALAAAPLAGQLNAPILVTYKGALDPQVQAEIVKLGAKNVYAVGALSTDTVASLKAISGVTVTPLQGADRTETAAKVAAQLTGVKGSFVVAYDGKADALSAASFAAANDYSIVIANPDGTIPASEKVVAPTYTVGGQVTVAGATALAGVDRYATNNAVLNGLDFEYDTVYVANGQSLVDALAGAPLAAQTNSPIVLGDTVGVATGANDNLTADSQVIALGGTGAVSDSVLAKVAYQAPATLAVESVSAINGIQLQVKFTQKVDKTAATTLSNYDIVSDNEGAITLLNGAVSLSSDNLTATITLDPDNYTLANDDSDVFVVSVKPIQAKDDVTESTELYSTTVAAKDETAPTVTKIKAVTNDESADQIEITFSEPIQSGVIRIDGDSYGSAKTFVADGTTMSGTAYKTSSNKITLTSSNGIDLAVDVAHSLQVSNLTDYSGNIAESISKDFDVTVDKVDPTVQSVKATGDSQIEVVFSEEVAPATVTSGIDVKDEAYEPVAVESIVDQNSDHNTYLITLDDGSLFDDKDIRTITLVFNGVEDTAGNTIENDTVKTVKLSHDETAPTLNGITYKKVGNNVAEVVATFSENVTGSAATIYPTVINPDGEDISSGFFSAYTIDDNKVTYELTTYSDLTGKYTFRFAKGAVTDVSADANKLPLSVETIDFGSGSSDKVSYTATAQVNGIPAIGSESALVTHISVVYDTTVGVTGSYGENYTLDGVRLDDAFITLSTVGGQTTADIEVPVGLFSEDVVNGDLTIRNVKNTDGDVLATKTVTVTGTVVDNVRPELTAAQVISDNEIVLTFNEDMAVPAGLTNTFFDNVLVITAGGKTLDSEDFTAVSAAYLTTSSDKKIVLTLTPAAISDWNDSKTITVKTKGSTIKDDAGNVMKAGVQVTATK